MYESFYGLKEKPFQIVPSPNYLYRSEKHQNALTYLEYGLKENVGFLLLTGEVGSGKTTLVQYLLSQLDPNTIVAVIFNTHLTAGELLRMILTQFELPPSEDKVGNLNTLNRFLVEAYGRGTAALLIIDEAQNLSDQALEEVRMLSNLHSDTHTLLQIVLVGQPELKAKLTDPCLRQVAQRIAVRYHLTGLSREDTGKYISYRLQTAGGRPDLFTKASVDLIHHISGGIPRSINLACQAALVYGFAEDAQLITQDIVRQIIKDNLGVGGESTGQMQEEESAGRCGASRPDAARDNGFTQRLDSMEKLVAELRGSVESRLRGIERGMDGQHHEALQRLTRLLVQERERHQDLARRHAQLEARYLHLRKLVAQAKERSRQMKAGKE